jgi:hypothetical protein
VGLATPTEAAAMGSFGGFVLAAAYKQLNFTVVKESVFLTAKTSAMVCWLFVGSSTFAASFALLGGQEIINTWVKSLDMTPTQFMLMAQVIIFLLGWPLEWTEIIVIFMPIFIPLLANFNIRPARGPEPPDGVPLAARGDGRLLPEGGGAAPCDAQPDLHRDDAVHGDPVFGDLPALPVPADRSMGAVLGVPLMIPASMQSRSGGVPNHYNLHQEGKDATFFVCDRHRRR